MQITKTSLNNAAEKNIITTSQATELFEFLKTQPTSQAIFNFTNILYYFGGTIAIGAMTLFMNLGWEEFGGWGMFIIAIIYAAIGLKLVHYFKNLEQVIAAGICAVFVVALTPMAVYGLQQAFGFWPEETTYSQYYKLIRWHWIYIELSTLVVGVIIASRYKYPFLTMPIAFTFWYMSMDITEIIFDENVFEFKALVSMYFGIFIILMALLVDIKLNKKADYAFWLYLFGVIAFWSGLTAQDSDNELSRFIYFVINILLIGTSALLARRVFAIFGAIGCFIYLEHLASSIFKDSWMFPFVLSAAGFLVVYLGLIWQKHEANIGKKIRNILPDNLKGLLKN